MAVIDSEFTGMKSTTVTQSGGTADRFKAQEQESNKI